MAHAIQVVPGFAAQFWEAEGPIGPGANSYRGVANTRTESGASGGVGWPGFRPASRLSAHRLRGCSSNGGCAGGLVVEWEVYKWGARRLERVQVGSSSIMVVVSLAPVGSMAQRSGLHWGLGPPRSAWHNGVVGRLGCQTPPPKPKIPTADRKVHTCADTRCATMTEFLPRIEN